ncbi:MAG: glycine zipper 2TM domain-containing protein [Cocleimonas sp.]|nr:glycine zipper 2TM domain-containing protein [Cocleimonas sp.]
MTSFITKSLLIATLSSTLMLTGCGGGNMSNEQLNTIVGSVVGGAVGHQFGKGDGQTVMTILGAAMGGYIGGQMGRDMNAYDQRKVSSALESAPNHQKVSWDNDNTNSAYDFTPINQYEGRVNGQRASCRDYIINAVDKATGRPMKVQGRACRNNRGQWIPVR